MSLYSGIAEIQKEYYRLIDQHFSTERAELQPITDDLDDRTYKIAQRSPIISFEGSTMPSTTYKAIKLVREIHEFWNEYGERLYSLVQQIPYQTLHAKSSFQTVLEEVKTSALYVDTIVVDDWIYGSKEMLEDRSREHQGELGITILNEYIHLLELRDLVLAQAVPPILIICPSPHYADKNLRSCSSKLAQWLGLQYASQLFNHQFNTQEEIVEYGVTIRSEKQLIQKIADPTLIWEDGVTLEAKIRKKLSVTGYSFNLSGFPFEMSRISPATSLVIHEIAGFDVLAQQYIDDDILDLDPKISPYHWEEYLWSLRFKPVRDGVVHVDKAKEETVVAHVLDLPEMAWLAKVPTESIISLRSQGNMEGIRSLFRDSRDRLKHIKPEEVAAITKEIKTNLESALTAHAQYLESSRKAEGKDWIKAIGGIVVAGGMAIATPYVPILTIPAIIIGLGYGGTSIRDLIIKYRKVKAQKQQVENRPIGMVWKARQDSQ